MNTRLQKILTLCLLAAALSLSGCYKSDGNEDWGDTGKYMSVSVGDHPKLDMKAVDGSAITSDSLRGNIVVLDFWASWCTACMDDAPRLVRLHKEYAPAGVKFVGVNFDTDAAARQRAASSHGFDWPHVTDGKGVEGPIGKSWGLQALPQAVILSAEGEVLWVGQPGAMEKHLAAAVRKEK